MEQDDRQMVAKFQAVARRWAEWNPDELLARLESEQDPFWMFKGENPEERSMMLMAMPVELIPSALKALLGTAPESIRPVLCEAVQGWVLDEAARSVAAMDPERRARVIAEGREIGNAMIDAMEVQLSGSRPQ